MTGSPITITRASPSISPSATAWCAISGAHKAMVLRNHGLLTCGRDCAEAFSLMYQLELACRVQMDVLAANAKYRGCRRAVVAEKAASQLWSYPMTPAELEWPGLLRKLDRLDPGYRD